MKKNMKNWFFGFIDRLFVVAGALIFSQAPQFFTQYMHRLAGHVEELRVHIKAIQQAAISRGIELPDYLAKFTQHKDSDINLHGQIVEGMFHRYSELSQASWALQESSLLSRPFIYIRYFNFDITKATIASFHPGVLLTAEGVIYAVVGMGVGYVCFRILHAICFFFFKKRIEKKI